MNKSLFVTELILTVRSVRLCAKAEAGSDGHFACWDDRSAVTGAEIVDFTVTNSENVFYSSFRFLRERTSAKPPWESEPTGRNHLPRTQPVARFGSGAV